MKIKIIFIIFIFCVFMGLSYPQPCQGAACSIGQAQTKIAELQTILACLATPTLKPTRTVTQATVSPTITRTIQPGGMVIFNADFEAGNLSYFDGDRGEIFGKGVYWDVDVVNTPVIGNYSASLTIGSGSSTAAYMFTYRYPSTPLASYSTDYYIPSSVDPIGGWWNVWQWKSIDNYYNKPIFSINLIKRSGVLQAVLFYTPGGISSNSSQTIYQGVPIPFPTDRWVNLSADYYSINNTAGYVVIYQDSIKIFEKFNINTKPGNKAVLWSINSYADRISPNPATIYVDNVKITER